LFKIGDVVRVREPGVLGFGECGRVLRPAEFSGYPIVDITKVLVVVQLPNYEVKYSEDCLEKVRNWRSIDD
jgi:hypothetical protein